ncbi:MAG: glycosyltransferase family 4 protein [Chitinophagaceae bacterium]
MRIVSLTYINSPDFNQPLDWIGRLYAFTGVLEELSKEHDVFSIEQINYSGDLVHKGVQYHFRNYGDGVTRFPFQLHKLVKQLQPDIVLVRGLNFPLQVIQLRFSLGKKGRIVVENHFDRPPVGIRKKFQQIAYPCINAYHFISASTATEWIKSGIIKDQSKCIEIAAGSARITPGDKNESKLTLGMNGDFNFLWVGSLSPRKDPMTVINGFEKYLRENPLARLYMIYQTEELLPVIKNKLDENATLQNAVFLKGKIPNEELGIWYSAADFFIMGSHAEGGSIALLEAIACGCIPVVTAIPAALGTTLNGEYGFHFEVGDVEGLYQQLLALSSIDATGFSRKLKKYFQEELSFRAIAGKFIDSCKNSPQRATE